MDPGCAASAHSRNSRVSLAPAGAGHEKATAFCPSSPRNLCQLPKRTPEVRARHLPQGMSLESSPPASGKVATLPSFAMRMQVPSPWFTSLMKSVVKVVCAAEKEAKLVARPSAKRKGGCIVEHGLHQPALECK